MVSAGVVPPDFYALFKALIDFAACLHSLEIWLPSRAHAKGSASPHILYHCIFRIVFWKQLDRTLDVSACVPCTVFCAESGAAVDFCARSTQLLKKQEQFRSLCKCETQKASIRFFMYSEPPNIYASVQRQGWNQWHGASWLMEQLGWL